MHKEFFSIDLEQFKKNHQQLYMMLKGIEIKY
jgi:hypothetical protein